MFIITSNEHSSYLLHNNVVTAPEQLKVNRYLLNVCDKRRP